MLRVPAKEEVVRLEPFRLALVEPAADREAAAVVHRMFDLAAAKGDRRAGRTQDAE